MCLNDSPRACVSNKTMRQQNKNTCTYSSPRLIRIGASLTFFFGIVLDCAGLFGIWRDVFFSIFFFKLYEIFKWADDWTQIHEQKSQRNSHPVNPSFLTEKQKVWFGLVFAKLLFCLKFQFCIVIRKSVLHQVVCQQELEWTKKRKSEYSGPRLILIHFTSGFLCNQAVCSDCAGLSALWREETYLEFCLNCVGNGFCLIRNTRGPLCCHCRFVVSENEGHWTHCFFCFI